MTFGPGLLRFVLSFIVVIQHMSSLRLGLVAVAVFFMLSGYWVTRLYDEQHRGKTPLSAFYLSRFLRIWLPFVAAVLAAMCLYALIGLPLDITDWRALPVLGIATHGSDPLGVSWSLDLELQFYLVVPLIAAFMATATPPWIIATTGLLWLSGTALDMATGVNLMLTALPAFVAGAAMHHWTLSASRGWALGSLALFGLACVLMALLPATRAIILASPKEIPTSVLAVVLSLTLAPFVLWTIRRRTGSLDRMLGDYSYSLYLVHYPLILAADHILEGDLGPQEKLPLLVVILVLSAAFFLLVDRPLERVRRILVARTYGRRPIPG